MAIRRKVISSCRSARNICGGYEVSDDSDSMARANADSYFAEQDKDGHGGEVRRVDSHTMFSHMTSTSSAGED